MKKKMILIDSYPNTILKYRKLIGFYYFTKYYVKLKRKKSRFVKRTAQIKGEATKKICHVFFFFLNY